MYVKLFQKMLDSSIWLESDSIVRVWVTLLLSMDPEGFAQFASIENLSRRARVKPSLTKKAIEVLESPDPDSTTPDDDGRRISRVAGGWQIVNCRKYRNISSHGELRASRNNPEQPGATQRNSEQLGLPSNLNTYGISESLPEKEIDVEKDKTTTPKALKGKRRSRSQVIAEYDEPTRRVVNWCIENWPKIRRGNNSPVSAKTPKLASRVDENLKVPNVTPELLIKGAEIYLSENPDWIHAPEHFFGPGKGDDAPWKPYARMAYHQQQKAAQ